MSETCAVCKKGKGPEKCEVCGFSDNGVINREWLNIEDANHWLDTVVKLYRVQWEATPLAQIEEPQKADEKSGSTPSYSVDRITSSETVTAGTNVFAQKKLNVNIAKKKKILCYVAIASFVLINFCFRDLEC